MGFRFRKSINFGPFRMNFSKSGIGYSVGGKGFRVTKRADGKVQTTASIPGTGISHVQTVKVTPKKTHADSVTASNRHYESEHGVYRVQTQNRHKTRKRVLGPVSALAGGILCIALAAFALLPDTSEPELPTDRVSAGVPVVSQPEVQESVSPETFSPEAAPAPDPAPQPEPEPVPSAPAADPAPVVPVQPDPAPQESAPVEPVAKIVIGNKNSKKYHETWCSSVGDIKESNRIEISSAEDARAKGYEPCQRCH